MRDEAARHALRLAWAVNPPAEAALRIVSLIASTNIAPRFHDRTRAAGARAHLIGIAGAGMQALAEVLLARGWQLSGSDPGAECARWLNERGVRIATHHSRTTIDDSLEQVIYSDAVTQANVERREAARLGLWQASYPQMVAHLMAESRGLAVAGTHGKSTTTAMIGAIMNRAGLDPTVICGATPAGQQSGGRGGEGEWLVAEACEYRENFRFLRPELALVLNIEFDHPDYFGSCDELTAAFGRFAERVPSHGAIVANADCPRVLRAVAGAQAAVVTYTTARSPAAGADWQAGEIRQVHGRYNFELRFRGEPWAQVLLQVPGRHQVTNALAAAAVCHMAGVRTADIVAGLESFRGLRRRLEFLGRAAGVELWDDYAHHPTEVRATLAALRTMYPGRRLWCVFQPHQVSRTRALVDEFAASLHNADRVAVSDVFVAREQPAVCPRAMAEELAERVRERGTEVLLSTCPIAILNEIVAQAQPGDIVITMGAGDIRKQFHELADRLRAHRTAG